MAEPESDPEGERPERAIARRPWRGDEHKLQVGAAAEVGLDGPDVELDLYTTGFKQGMTIDDRADGAIVFRGRTVLKEPELGRALKPLLHYLRVPFDALRVKVHDGRFELRIAGRSADSSKPALGGAKLALQVWIGFGLLGVAAMQFLPRFVAAIAWGVGLLLGAWELRKGIASGRAMLAARFALGLAMLAREEQLILPPGEGA